VVLQGIKPLELVGHVLVVEGAAVGDVEAPDPDPAAGGGHGTCFLDGILARLAEMRLVQ
jgi:hypothetical protein